MAVSLLLMAVSSHKLSAGSPVYHLTAATKVVARADSPLLPGFRCDLVCEGTFKMFADVWTPSILEPTRGRHRAWALLLTVWYRSTGVNNLLAAAARLLVFWSCCWLCRSADVLLTCFPCRKAAEHEHHARLDRHVQTGCIFWSCYEVFLQRAQK